MDSLSSYTCFLSLRAWYFPIFTVTLPKCQKSHSTECLLDALTVQLFFCGFITWMTAQDTLLPILLAKKTYSFWRSHFVLYIWFLRCVVFCCHPLPLPHSLWILNKFHSVLLSVDILLSGTVIYFF